MYCIVLENLFSESLGVLWTALSTLFFRGKSGLKTSFVEDKIRG